jgi:hypothetical protein
MKRIEFDSKHEMVFAQNGFNTFEDFIYCIKGKIINRNKKRNVSILHLPSKEGIRVYFMKRFFSPHFKDMLFTVRNLGKLCSLAELELKNTRILLDYGIETYHPVCWGAQTCCGIEQRSFFITEKIHGLSLIEFLFNYWNAFDMVQREQLMVELARFFRKLHKARLSLPDSYLWHLFLMEPIDTAKPYKFAIIDLHRMQINVPSTKHAAWDLAAFLFSLPYEWFDKRLRDLFLNTHMDFSNGTGIKCRKDFQEAVGKRERILMTRRQKPDLEYLKMMV